MYVNILRFLRFCGLQKAFTILCSYKTFPCVQDEYQLLDSEQYYPASPIQTNAREYMRQAQERDSRIRQESNVTVSETEFSDTSSEPVRIRFQKTLAFLTIIHGICTDTAWNPQLFRYFQHCITSKSPNTWFLGLCILQDTWYLASRTMFITMTGVTLRKTVCQTANC